MRNLRALILLTAVLPAYGSIIQFTGVTVLSSPPPSVVKGALQSNSTIFAFEEQQGVDLTTQVYAGIDQPGTYTCCTGLNGGYIPAGTEVDSYFLHADPTAPDPGKPYRLFDGSVTFSSSEQIIGIVLGWRNIQITDAQLGAPGTTYGSGDNYFGLENGDVVTLSDDMHTVTVKFYISPDHANDIRIITAVPEPVDFLLIGSGLVFLGFLGKRLRRSRAQA